MSLRNPKISYHQPCNPYNAGFPLKKTAIRFTLQPVLIEYLTERLIDQVGNEMKIRTIEVADYTTERLVEQLGAEITSGKIALLNTHALIEALGQRLCSGKSNRINLGNPWQQKLLALFGIREELEAHLKQLLSTLRQKFPHQPGYAAGNILNLLIHLGSELNRFRFLSSHGLASLLTRHGIT